MATYQSPEEIKEQYIEKMCSELGKAYYALHNELIWLYTKTNMFIELYGSGEKRVKLLNDTAAVFFFVIQKTLWEDLLLHIGRITDPPVMKGKKNLTIKLLPDLISNKLLKQNQTDGSFLLLFCYISRTNESK